MFKKTKIAMATAAMLGSAAVVPVAEAVSVNPDGLGQVLIYPYYNTNNGFQTSFNIRNTKDEYKAIKIRLRESENSNDVLDFNVFLSPFDVFTFTVVPDGANSPRLVTIDKSCTYPTIPPGGVSLKGNVYVATDNDDAKEGYVEVIELGVIDETLVTGGTQPAVVPTARTATTIVFGLDHGTTGTPADCSVVGPSGLAGGTWVAGGSIIGVTAAAVASYQGLSSPTGFNTPTGGLAGTSILLDVPNGAAFVADPIALVNYAADHSVATGTPVQYLGSVAATSFGNGAQYYRPDVSTDFLLPSLASGNVNTSEVLDSSNTAVLQATWSTVQVDWSSKDPSAAIVGGGVTPVSGVNPFPVSHALAATGFNNEYFIDASLNGATDWVVTFPMRKHGVFNDTYHDGTVFRTYAGQNVESTSDNSSAPLAGATDDVTFAASKFYDREEQEATPDSSQFSPVVTGSNLRLIREVNILSFTNSGVANNSVLGSTFENPFVLQAGFNTGWAPISLINNSYNLDAADQHWTAWVLDNTATASIVGGSAVVPATPSYLGVPTMGFAAIRGQVSTSDAGKNIGETIPMVFSRSRGTF